MTFYADARSRRGVTASGASNRRPKLPAGLRCWRMLASYVAVCVSRLREFPDPGPPVVVAAAGIEPGPWTGGREHAYHTARRVLRIACRRGAG